MPRQPATGGCACLQRPHRCGAESARIGLQRQSGAIADDKGEVELSRGLAMSPKRTVRKIAHHSLPSRRPQEFLASQNAPLMQPRLPGQETHVGAHNSGNIVSAKTTASCSIGVSG